MTRADSQVTSWQQKALLNGRTPLPERPGHRPWLDPEFCLSDSVPARSGTGHYKFWTYKELDRLVLLRQRGLSWDDLQLVFPDRAMDGIKRAYHNQREAVEKRLKDRAEKAKAQRAMVRKTKAEKVKVAKVKASRTRVAKKRN